MTQTTSIDLGSLVANRQASPARPASRPQSEFETAYRQASETQEPVKQREPDRSAARPERERPAESTPDTDPPTESNQAEAPAKTEGPKPEQAPKSEQAADSKESASVAEGEAQPQVEAPATEAPVAEAPAPQTPEEAQALLALMLATGAQVNPQANAAQGTEAAATTTEAQAVAQASAELATEAQAELAERVADAAKAQGKGQANAAAQTQASSHAEAAEHANENAKLPAFLAQAAQGLGAVKVQSEKTAAPTVQAPAAPVEEGVQNLSIQLLDASAVETTNLGSNTPVTLLDDAEGIEMTSQFVNLLTDETEETLAAADADAEQPPLLNGERPLHDAGKLTLAGGKEAGQPAPAAKAEDVLPQILKYADAIKANQQNSIKLQLYPEQLGKMEIKVTSHAGVISAQLTADSHQVKSMLESQVAMLQRSFAELGLKVDKVEVTLSSANMQFDTQNGSMAQGNFQQGQQQQQHDARSGLIAGSGYEQWLGDEPADEAEYADLSLASVVNYVA